MNLSKENKMIETYKFSINKQWFYIVCVVLQCGCFVKDSSHKRIIYKYIKISDVRKFCMIVKDV